MHPPLCDAFASAGNNTILLSSKNVASTTWKGWGTSLGW